MSFSKQRGMIDIYGDDVKYFNRVETILRVVSEQYNVKEVRTPLVEAANLYTKSIGDTSDIVHKEFYNFKDKGDREIALRPEGTAGTIRFIVEEKLIEKSNVPVKVFYMGPMFRYERPQSGRQRQFHQYGVEVVGNITPADEVEVICLALSILQLCRVQNFELQINNIGSPETRKKWIEELKNYFKKYRDKLSPDSQKRIDSNPLRILDDKDDSKKDFVKKAPSIDEFMTADEKKYFKKIRELLNTMNIDYKVNKNLVRGLDYYSGLVFEIISKSDKLKGQSTIIGGGKYEGLVQLTGGPNVPGVGFGLGIERLIIAIKEEAQNFINKDYIDIVFAPLSQKCSTLSLLINLIIRSLGFSVATNHGTYKLEKHFKFAESLNAKMVIILGDKELEDEELLIKNQKTMKEKRIKIQDIETFLKENKN